MLPLHIENETGTFDAVALGPMAVLPGRQGRGIGSRLVGEALERLVRAGHPLVGAFQLIATEVPPPVGGLFAEICQAQEMGLTIERAILEVGRTFNNADVRIFGTSVAIQLRSGGNLADMMDRLAYVIRDRMRLSRRVRVLTAQTQFSKRILAVLPVVVFVVLSSVNPKYMSTMYSTQTGRYLLTIAAVGVLLGIWIMNRISVIRY